MALIGVISILVVLVINKSHQHQSNNVDQFSVNHEEMVKTVNEMLNSASKMVKGLNPGNSAANELDEENNEKLFNRLFYNSKFEFQMDENAQKILKNYWENVKNEEINGSIKEMATKMNASLKNQNQILANILKNSFLTNGNKKDFAKLIELSMNGFVQFSETIKAKKLPIITPKNGNKNSLRRRKRADDDKCSGAIAGLITTGILLCCAIATQLKYNMNSAIPNYIYHMFTFVGSAIGFFFYFVKMIMHCLC